MDKTRFYRKIPKIDGMLHLEIFQTLIEIYGKPLVVQAMREETQDIRKHIEIWKEEEIEDAIEQLPFAIQENVENAGKYHMRKVINGTGTIIHTNLGRSPISVSHAKRMGEIASGYTNLEYDLDSGSRAQRCDHFEELLCRLTGAQAAIAVNNNAAAVTLLLSALCKKKEVIVSRGELVEIGGKFRIPEVMEQSGARLIEVGATNKTRLSDYEQAVTDDTGMLLKVHTSNYKVVGFTESVSTDKLVKLGKRLGIPVAEDLGSGVFIDLEKYGLSHEPTVGEVIRKGADLVCFSGDKLLGGPQAGIIAGKKEYIAAMKNHPLMRALRVDKFTAFALESVLHEYLDERKAIERIPVLRMLTKSLDTLEQEADILYRKLLESKLQAKVNVADGFSCVGGGSLPTEEIPSKCIAITHDTMPCEELKKKLRQCKIPIIVRVEDDTVMVDIRTVLEEEHEILMEELIEVLKKKE